MCVGFEILLHNDRMPRPLLVFVALFCAPLLAHAPRTSTRPPIESPVDRAFAKFFSANDPQGASHLVDEVLASGVSFDEAWRRLRAGRTYEPGPKTGNVSWEFRSSDTSSHQTLVRVPSDYDASTPLQVRVQLRGGINYRRSLSEMRDRPNATEGAHEIYLIPVGGPGAAWWHDNQVENILAMLDRLKRTYNIDENHVHVTGFSDGATGAYFMAMRETTPWSSVLPLNGHPYVLSNPSTGVQGDLYLSNLVNKPLFIVNGGNDPLYPTSSIDPYVRLLERLGAPIVYRPQADAGHDLNWWPRERERFEAFVREHPRDPQPDRLSWTTDRTDRYNRAHWLVITRLGASAGESAFPDDNTVEDERRDFGIRLDEKSPSTRIRQVIAGSPASVLGLQKGDTIVEINGEAVESGDDVVEALGAHDRSAALSVGVERKGRRVALEKTLTPSGVSVFRHRGPAGRLDAIRTGHTIKARTRGVRAFTLLVSPDRFDFSQAVRVVVNDRVMFDGVVEKDLPTLLRWAARDNDRTMLVGAEIAIELSADGK